MKYSYELKNVTGNHIELSWTITDSIHDSYWIYVESFEEGIQKMKELEKE